MNRLFSDPWIDEQNLDGRLLTDNNNIDFYLNGYPVYSRSCCSASEMSIMQIYQNFLFCDLLACIICRDYDGYISKIMCSIWKLRRDITLRW